MKSKTSVLFLLLFVFGLNTIAQTSDSFPDIIEKIKPSVVSVTTYDGKGKGLSHGTGFCVSTNRIITNYHVIEGAVRIEIKTADNNTYKVVKVESGDKSSDLAVLQTEQLDETVRPLRLSSIPPRIGEKVLVVGNPLGLSGSVSDGLVSAFRNVANIGKLIQITAPISHGSSGSPVININGEVIGIATLNLEGGQNLNFAISSESIISRWANILSITNDKPVKAAQATNRWRQLLGERITYDTETATKGTSIVSAWIRYEEVDGSYEKVLTEINCKNSQIRQSRSLSYNKNGDLSRQKDTPTNWNTLVPDSNGESIYKIFCKDEPDYESLQDWFRRKDLIEKGSHLMESKNYDEAVDIYSQLIEEFPESAAYAFSQIGLAKQNQGNLQSARYAFLEAIKIEPKDLYYLELAENYEKEKNIPAAIDAYWKSLRLDKEYGISKFKLEMMYRQAKDYKALSTLYKYLIELGEVDYYDELGDAYEKQGSKTLARSTRMIGVKLIEKEIVLNLDHAYSFQSLAALYKSLDNPAKFLAVLVSGVDKYPKDFLLTHSLAELYCKGKRWTEAVQVVKNGMPFANDDYYKKRLLIILKDAYVGLNQLDDAAEIDRQLSQLK